MQNAGTLWGNLLKGNHVKEVRFTINGIEYGHSRIVSARIMRSCMQTLSIGNAVSATLELSFYPVGSIPPMAEIICEMRLKEVTEDIYVGDEDGNVMMTEDGFIIAAQYARRTDWIQRGRFYVDTRKMDKQTGLLTVMAYDKMLFAEAPYIDQTGTYPMAMSTAVSYIAGQLGVEVDARNQIYAGQIDSPTHVYNMREVLRFIAAASGGNFIISDEGKLRLVPLLSPAADAAAYPCSELHSIGDEITITGVRLLPDSDTEYFAGSADGYVIEGECAYATQSMCQAVLSRLQSVRYRPLEAWGVLLDPALEIGDSVNLGGVVTILAQDDAELGPATVSDVAAPIEDELEHEIPYQSRDRDQRMTATSFSEIRKSTSEIALEVKGKIGATEANTLIKQNLEGITLSASAGVNQSSIKIMAGSIEIASAIVKFSNIWADQVNASDIIGRLLSSQIDLYGDLTVYKDEDLDDSGGSLGYAYSSKDRSGGIHIASSGSEVRATGLGATMEGADGAYVVATDNVTLGGNYIFFYAGAGCEMAANRFNPLRDWGMDLGTSGQRWGTVYAGGGVVETSDRAVKKDIVYGLDRYDAFFDALRPCSFRMDHKRADDKINTGLIVQDIDEILPTVGLTREDFAGLHMSDNPGESGLDYTKFIGLLIDQVQKLKKDVAELKQGGTHGQS